MTDCIAAATEPPCVFKIDSTVEFADTRSTWPVCGSTTKLDALAAGTVAVSAAATGVSFVVGNACCELDSLIYCVSNVR